MFDKKKFGEAIYLDFSLVKKLLEELLSSWNRKRIQNSH